MVLERYSTTTMMGSIWAKIWGKRSTSDKLASICERLSSIEEFNRNTLERQKKLIGRLLVYFASLYLLSVTFVYFRYGGDPQWRQGWQQQLKLLLPFLVSPFVAWLVKRLLAAWYRRQLRNNDVAMKKLIVAKAKILEEVMETETYKVAKDLLDRYGSGKSTVAAAAVKTPVVVKQELRQRRGVAPPSPPPPPDVTTTTDRGDFHPVVRGGGGATTTTLGMPPMPRPVLPRERGYVDRIVEYLVGDGPSNRYALVCRQCQSHNGMALREEFEYVSYRCCYCFCWNPARKQRPSAPKLLTKGSSPSPSSPSSTSSSSSSSGRGGGGGDKNDDDDNEAIFQTSRHFAEVEEEEEEQLTKSAPEINPNKTDDDDDAAKVDEDVAADGKKEME